MAIINSYSHSGPTYTSGNVICPSSSGKVTLRENEADPLHKIDIVLGVTATLRNTTSSSVNIWENVVKASVTGSSPYYNGSVGNEQINSLAAYASANIAEETILGTIDRGVSSSTYSGRLNITASTTQSYDFSLTVPPLKQNIVSGSYRVVYTNNGVEYDLLNYL